MVQYYDEDAMSLSQIVSNYSFLDENDQPICFSILPFQREGQSIEIGNKKVFLHGIVDDGLMTIYRQVIAWKVDLEGIQPKIYVYTKDNKTIMLLKPRKSFEDSIRKILITIQCIHYLKTNQDSTEKLLWKNVRKAFSHYEVQASLVDILDHVPFIRKVLENDVTLAKSKFLVELSTQGYKKLNAFSEGLLCVKNSNFIDDNDENDVRNGGDKNDELDQESVSFDSVCFICDDGGELLCCEGKCLRSFHAIKTVTGSRCPTLGYTRAQVDAMSIFKCLNCRYEVHQCFACGRLDSSNPSSAKVFRCANATCGHFYHPKCVARLIHEKNEIKATLLQRKIAEGKQFICPFHKCIVCKNKEDKYNRDLQFAMCRRCPTSYHRKCLPRDIVFEGSDNETPRAWDGLLPYRILIYCMQHKIDDTLGTPRRNHFISPEDLVEEKDSTSLQSNKLNCSAKRKTEHTDIERTAISTTKEGMYGFKKREDEHHLTCFKKVKIKSNPSKTSHVAKVSASGKSGSLNIINKEEQNIVESTQYYGDDILSHNSASKRPNTLNPLVDNETEKRIMMLVKKSSISFLSFEDFTKTHAYSATHRRVDKTITLGKVEGSMEAVQMAVQKIDEDNGNTDNAKDVCEPELLHQIMKWRKKLAVYLAPFLHGPLYKSIGRHFTKIDKIVDRLQFYVQSGDMIVDICSGANDFGVILKEKLEASGKTCQYRNYYIIPSKNDFNFVKKDWMEVQKSELITGSQLIICVKPPSGVQAALNKFINKALEFKPKLVILIAPKEAERLDEKETKYTLIWEDEIELSGKAFYLPGTTDKQMEQRNVQPHILSMWSRPDWVIHHMKIAETHEHVNIVLDEFPVLEDWSDTNTNDDHVGEMHDGCPNVMDDDSLLGLNVVCKDGKQSLESLEKLDIHERKKSNSTDESSTEKSIKPSIMIISSPAQKDSLGKMDSHHLDETFESTLKRRTSGCKFYSFRSLDSSRDNIRVLSTTFPDKGLDNMEDDYATARREIPYSKSSHCFPPDYQYMLPGQNPKSQIRAKTQRDISTATTPAFSNNTIGSLATAMSKNTFQTSDSNNLSPNRYPLPVNDSDRVQLPDSKSEIPFVGTRTGNALNIGGSWSGWIPNSNAFAPVPKKPLFDQGSSGWLDD